MSYLAKIKELYDLMGQGQMMEGFEKFYHEDVEVYEPTGEVRKGKAAQREANQGWQQSVKEWHGGGYNAITSNEEAGITSVESWFDITFQDGNRRKMEEVGVQHWKDGQIVKERFYYFIPPAPAE